ncbi:MAG: response regulator transcription factor [Pseudomonadota bacterium]
MRGIDTEQEIEKSRDTRREVEDFANLLASIKPARRAALSGSNSERIVDEPYILIVDRMTFFRETLQAFLEGMVNEFRAIGISDVDAMAEMAPETQRNVEIVLLCIGDRMIDDPESRRELSVVRSFTPQAAIIMIGDSVSAEQVAAAMKLEVSGYVSSATKPGIFPHVLRLVQAGGTYFPTRPPTALAGTVMLKDPERRASPICSPAVTRAVTDGSALPAAPSAEFSVQPSRSHHLTRREREVLECLGKGLQNKLIAYELDLQESTVKVHVRNILKKLNVRSRTQAALAARDTLEGRH